MKTRRMSDSLCLEAMERNLMQGLKPYVITNIRKAVTYRPVSVASNQSLHTNLFERNQR
jgi:hypothetical protein